MRLSAQQMAQAAAFVLNCTGLSGRRSAGRYPVMRRLRRANRSIRSRQVRRQCTRLRRRPTRDRRGGHRSTRPAPFAALPELARARGGPLAMVSPLNSYVGLTRPAAGAPPDELRSLYPGGRRHFARVFPTDDHQAVALAALAAELGDRRVAILDDGDLLYGRALADRFALATRSLGSEVVVRRRWNPEASSYSRLVAAVARTRPRRHLPRWHPRLKRARRAPRASPSRGPRAGDPARRGVHANGLAGAPGRTCSRGRLPQRQRTHHREHPGARPSLRRQVRTHPAWGGHRAERRLHRRSNRRAPRRDRELRRLARRVLDALFATDVERGLTGPVRFDRRGDIVAPPITILKVRRGARQLATFPGAVLHEVVRSRGGG